MSFRLFVLGVCASVLFSCKARPQVDQSGLDFAIGSADYSLLKDIEAKNGRIPVCLALIGFASGEEATAGEQFKAMLLRAANAWNSLLRGHPDWPVQGKIEIDFKVSSQQCQPVSTGFTMTVWRNEADFRRDYCNRPGYVCASGGSAERRAIFIGPVNRDKPDNIYDYFTILHEYGHVLGMGDTYRNKGMSDWEVDQPPSVMNGQNFPPEAFTTDDKWGLWAVLWAVKTGRRDCRGYGKEVEMKLNRWKDVMCDPRSEPKYVHRNISEITGLPERQDQSADVTERKSIPVDAGKWRYKGHDEASKWVAVSRIEGQPDSFRTIGFVNGESKSETGTVYKCEPALDFPFPRECTATSDENYKIVTWGRKRMILKTPALPDGVELTWFQPTLNWSL